MLVCSSGVDVSTSALRFLAAHLRELRRALGTRWRRLNAGRQALITLAHLRNGQPYAQLAAGFEIGTTTAYRYITEAVNLLAALANRSHAKIRALAEQAIATLKSCRLLRRLRCSTTRITRLVQAVLVLQLAASG
ncbi:hypothetical protein GCM10010306_099290 [Streptomyces umbrinus]|uniref:helix-turn-helix domain-containing protein n=1 Tax=Streptomyces umbrinus TaxID=67370 RepID=UPI001678EE31|nr:transposase family protein [Streptomyces umbrinus]GHB88405.1 hypothetical protein GCM10010306_099290 [Streptomyces umbrinus]